MTAIVALCYKQYNIEITTTIIYIILVLYYKEKGQILFKG